MQINTFLQNENLKHVTHSRLMTGRLCMPSWFCLEPRKIPALPMSFHNIPAMGEGHPLKAETFPASSVKDTSCFTQNIIVKYFLYWAKCVWYWGVGEGKDLASVRTLGPGIYVTPGGAGRVQVSPTAAHLKLCFALPSCWHQETSLELCPCP